MSELGELLSKMVELIESVNEEVRELRSKLLHHELEHELHSEEVE